MTQKIKGLALDFGRVLALFNKDRVWKKLSKYSHLTSAEIETAIVKSGLEKKFDSGEISAFVFYTRAVADAHLLNILQKEFFKIWSDIFSPIPDIESVLAKLKPNIPRVVVSNTNEEHWKTIQALPVMKKFFPNPSKHVLSCDVGVTKPDLHMYLAALPRLDIFDSHTVLFIDDIEENVLAARKFGFTAEQFDGSKEPASKLEDILASYGVLT